MQRITYTLMNDIPLTKGSTWTLPDGFAGAFNDAAVTEDAPLYDADTDTIYVYNQYQLATINDPEAIKTVMSKDMIAKDFGMGQVVYADADQNTQLEYTDSHNYVVSKDFTEEMPELTAVEVQSEVTTQLGGRDYIGQVYKEIDGEKYILIGNEQQLRAIGEDIRVTPMLFTEKTVLDGLFESHKEYEPYYPGDADLNLTSLTEVSIGENELGKPIYENNFSFKKADGTLANVNFSLSGVSGYRSLDSTGKIDPDKNYSDLSKEYGSLKYTSSANYIIFRNIDFSKGDFSDGNAENLWTPIMFSGNMIGALADDQHTLEALVTQPTSEKVDPKNIPVLTGITIKMTEIMNQKTTKGVGFFASLSTAQSGDAKLADMAVSGKKIIVKNLALDTVAVDNAYSKIANPPTGIIDGLLELLGAVVDPGHGAAACHSALSCLAALSLRGRVDFRMDEVYPAVEGCRFSEECKFRAWNEFFLHPFQPFEKDRLDFSAPVRNHHRQPLAADDFRPDHLGADLDICHVGTDLGYGYDAAPVDVSERIQPQQVSESGHSELLLQKGGSFRPHARQKLYLGIESAS